MSQINDATNAKSPPAAKRINIAANQAMRAAIDYMIEREQVTLTEAVRRLIAYGDFMYRTVKDERTSIAMRKADGPVQEIVLI